VLAGTDGLLLTQEIHPIARPGTSIAKIVGTEMLPDRVGYLLEN
jgi:hypothetical protein